MAEPMDLMIEDYAEVERWAQNYYSFMMSDGLYNHNDNIQNSFEAERDELAKKYPEEVAKWESIMIANMAANISS